MGKNRVIKSLGKNIGNLTVHKILVKHTNNPETLNHLKYEVINYRENAFEISKEFNWNEKDKEEIKLEALKRVQRDIELYYSDVKFPSNEPEQLVLETLKEFELI